MGAGNKSEAQHTNKEVDDPSKMKKIEVGHWVVVKFEMLKKVGQTRKFIGEVKEKKDDDSFIGEFLRPAATKTNLGFVYRRLESGHEDVTSFDQSQIVKILNPPVAYGRYGLLKFDVKIE